MYNISIRVRGDGDPLIQAMNQAFDGFYQRIRKLRENPLFAGGTLEESTLSQNDLQVVINASLQQFGGSRNPNLGDPNWPEGDFKVSLAAYEQVQALNEASEHIFHCILALAKSRKFDECLLQPCAWRHCELQSRLNAALASKISETEIKQADQLHRLIVQTFPKQKGSES